MMTLNTKQQQFLDLVQKGDSVFLTGKAGTGKSFVTKEAIRILSSNGKRVVALAPTGIAANNIGGQTIHSFFYITPFGVIDYDQCNFLKAEKRELIKKLDTIVIDEVSMMRPDLLDAINFTMQKNGCGSLSNKQVIFIGDMKQLQPPINDNTKSVLLEKYDHVTFEAATIFNKISPSFIELDDVLRQDNPEFIGNLNIIREGGKSEYFRSFVGKGVKGVVLAPHKATVARYNIEGLAAIDSEEIEFKAIVEGKINIADFNIDPVITVKQGAKIMYLVNSQYNNLYNGMVGEFAIKGGEYFIRVGNVDYLLEQKEFTKKEYIYNREKDEIELKTIGTIRQYPITLAYAITIHKSQGMTFDQCTLDLTQNCFATGQLYVALSRVRTPEGLSIIY